MKQRKWLQLFIYLILTTLFLDACTFSVEVLSTPTASLPALTPLPTATPAPILTATVPPSITPTRISIRAGTTSMLENFNSFEVPDVVRSLAFSPDSTILAAATGNDEDFSVHLWNVANGEALGTLDGHTGIVWDAVFSPDGKLLASASNDQTVKIWDWQNKTLITSLDFPGAVSSVRFSPDGQALAVGGVDVPEGQIQQAAVWTYAVGSWKPLLKFPEYLNVIALAYSPKGGVLIGGGTSRNVQVWNAGNGERIFTLNHAHQVFKAAISPNGSTAATATCENVLYPECAEGSVWLWDLPSGKLLRKLAGFPNFVEQVAFTPDGSVLVAASRDGTLRFYGTSDYELQFELTVPGGINALALSPDGGLLVTGSSDGMVHLWKNVYHP
ncbi:MAG TPA: WD40 repeat domain-containing protein [Anaerolineales bacterium]|nr:WD40 repeat domain-containing protein [Anaerolineales bacterium]